MDHDLYADLYSAIERWYYEQGINPMFATRRELQYKFKFERYLKEANSALAVKYDDPANSLLCGRAFLDYYQVARAWMSVAYDDSTPPVPGWRPAPGTVIDPRPAKVEVPKRAIDEIDTLCREALQKFKPFVSTAWDVHYDPKDALEYYVRLVDIMTEEATLTLEKILSIINAVDSSKCVPPRQPERRLAPFEVLLRFGYNHSERVTPATPPESSCDESSAEGSHASH